MTDYIKGPEPDRWHWYKNCPQYPRVIMQTRNKRPTYDLCDECLNIERIELRKVATTHT